MLKYIIFILIFNILYSAQSEQFDIYEIKNRKPVENVIKRFVGAEGQTNIESNPVEPVESKPSRHENTDSVKKELKNENPKANVSPEKSQTSDKKENQQMEKNEDAKQQTNNEPSTAVVNNPTSNNQNETVIVEESNKKSNLTDSSSTQDVKIPKHAAVEHPGAALRGFYVFLGLSVLIIIYFVFKAFKLRPGAPPPTTVRKYGIVGRRSDMEMLPLPLAEEEDDDTLFDMGTQAHR